MATEQARAGRCLRPEHEEMHVLGDRLACALARGVLAQRAYARFELSVRQAGKKRIGAKGELVGELLPIRGDRLKDKLVSQKAQAGALEQLKHLIAGWQFGLHDHSEPTKEPRLRIKTIARGVAHKHAPSCP